MAAVQLISHLQTTLIGASFGLLMLQALLFISSLFLMMLVLVQRGKGGGLTGALGGMGGQSAFGSKAGDAFTKITVITSMVWIMLCMVTIAMYNPPPPPKTAADQNAASGMSSTDTTDSAGASATGDAAAGSATTGGSGKAAAGGTSESSTGTSTGDAGAAAGSATTGDSGKAADGGTSGTSTGAAGTAAPTDSSLEGSSTQPVEGANVDSNVAPPLELNLGGPEEPATTPPGN